MIQRQGPRVLLLVFQTGLLTLLLKAHASIRGEYDIINTGRITWLSIYIVITWFGSYATGIPEATTRSTRAISCMLAGIAPPVVFAVFQAARGEVLLPRLFLITSTVMLILVNYLAIRVYEAIFHRIMSIDRVILLGSIESRFTLEKDLVGHREKPCELAGHLPPEGFSSLSSMFTKESNMGSIVLVIEERCFTGEELRGQLALLHSQGARVRTLRDFYSEWLGKVPLGELSEKSLFFDIPEIHAPWYSRISRTLDLFVAFSLSPLLLASIPIVALGNLAGNKGRLFYAQERVGRYGQVFKILKYRSMRTSAAPTTWTVENDPRITSFGKILRLTHIDELPQLINILRGELSLVGPRPEQVHYVKELAVSIPYYEQRHLVRPGLTGWAQVNYPYGANKIDAMQKLQFEFWYIEHQSLRVDFLVLARTVRHVLGLGGR